MIEVTLDTARIEQALARLLRKTGDLRPALEAIGVSLVASTQQRFAISTGPGWNPMGTQGKRTIYQ